MTGDDCSVYVPEERRTRKPSVDIQEQKKRIVMHFLRRPLDSEAEVGTTYILKIRSDFLELSDMMSSI